MNTQAVRPIRLGLAALVALVSALAALAVSNGSDAHAHDTASVADVSAKELKLRNDMRVLWEDHVTWTRLAVISLVGGTPDTDATVARLLRNQTDIGNAVKPFYGRAAGNALTGELRKHILIAADVIAAAKAGNKAELTRQQALWQRNADDIAVLLEQGEPALLEAAGAEGDAAPAPGPDDRRGRRPARGAVGGRGRGLRPRAPARARDGRRPLDGPRQAVPAVGSA